MMKQLKIRWLLCIFSLVLYLANPLFVDTAVAACGPCTDSHGGSWSGVGNGACGRCGTRTYTFSSGSCQNTNSSSCSDYNKYATFTEEYESEPVGTIAYAACCVLHLGMSVAALAALAAAVPACATACVGTIGAACVACLAGAGALEMGVACSFAECVEWCTLENSYYSSSTVPGCNG
jgi:hypothetical protein